MELAMNACNQCIEKKMMTSFSPFEHEIHTKLISDVCRTSFHSTTALLLQMNPFFSASISHALSFSSISHKMVTSLITQHLFKRQPCFRIDHLASHLPSRKPSLTLSTPVLCASPQHATVMTITHTVHTRPVCIPSTRHGDDHHSHCPHPSCVQEWPSVLTVRCVGVCAPPLRRVLRGCTPTLVDAIDTLTALDPKEYSDGHNAPIAFFSSFSF